MVKSRAVNRTKHESIVIKKLDENWKQAKKVLRLGCPKCKKPFTVKNFRTASGLCLECGKRELEIKTRLDPEKVEFSKFSV